MSDNQEQSSIQDMSDAQQQIAAFPNLESMLPGGLTQEQALAFQQFQAMHGVLPVLAGQFPRPTVKRRKPVKWELWEEKNLIEGVRRFGRGNWAQIRAAFEFNPCRTNVDLHDKWRVLTGERKRNRHRPDSSSSGNGNNSGHNVITAEIPSEGSSQKVQLVPVAGTNGLYTLASSWPSHLLEGQAVQFPPEFLQQLQQGDLLSQSSSDVIAAMAEHQMHHDHGLHEHDMNEHHHHHHNHLQHSDHLDHHVDEEEIENNHVNNHNNNNNHHHNHHHQEDDEDLNNVEEDEIIAPAKKQRKKKEESEDEVAKELLKLSSPKQRKRKERK